MTSTRRSCGEDEPTPTPTRRDGFPAALVDELSPEGVALQLETLRGAPRYRTRPWAGGPLLRGLRSWLPDQG